MGSDKRSVRLVDRYVFRFVAGAAGAAGVFGIVSASRVTYDAWIALLETAAAIVGFLVVRQRAKRDIGEAFKRLNTKRFFWCQMFAVLGFIAAVWVPLGLNLLLPTASISDLRIKTVFEGRPVNSVVSIEFDRAIHSQNAPHGETVFRGLHLEAGSEVMIRVEAQGFEDAFRTETVPEYGTIDVCLVQRVTKIEGQVLWGRTGEPVGEARILLAGVTAQTDSGGRFTVSVTGPDRIPARMQVWSSDRMIYDDFITVPSEKRTLVVIVPGQ